MIKAKKRIHNIPEWHIRERIALLLVAGELCLAVWRKNGTQTVHGSDGGCDSGPGAQDRKSGDRLQIARSDAKWIAGERRGIVGSRRRRQSRLPGPLRGRQGPALDGYGGNGGERHHL